MRDSTVRDSTMSRDQLVISLRRLLAQYREELMRIDRELTPSIYRVADALARLDGPASAGPASARSPDCGPDAR